MGEPEVLDKGIVASMAITYVYNCYQEKRIDKLWKRVNKDSKLLLCQRSALKADIAMLDWPDIPRAERLCITNYLRSVLVTLGSIGVDMVERAE